MRHQGGASPAPTAACMSSDRPEAQCRAEAVLHRHAVARWQGAGEVVGADLDRGEGGAALRVDARAQGFDAGHVVYGAAPRERSEEHTSELQSLMRISYAVFC